VIRPLTPHPDSSDGHQCGEGVREQVIVDARIALVARLSVSTVTKLWSGNDSHISVISVL